MEKILVTHYEYISQKSSQISDYMAEATFIRDRTDIYSLHHISLKPEDRHVYGNYKLLSCKPDPDFDW